MSATNHKLHVFICHSSQDKSTVRELYQRFLSEDWIDPWLDEVKLLPGQTWELEIEKAVETADAVIVCLSTSSVSKEGYIQRELKYVLDIALEKPEGTIFIIPLRLDNCEPPRRLREWQYADYFPVSIREISFARLLASLRNRAMSIGIQNIEQMQKIGQKETTKNTASDFGEIKSRDGLRYFKVTNECLINKRLPNKIFYESPKEDE